MEFENILSKMEVLDRGVYKCSGDMLKVLNSVFYDDMIRYIEEVWGKYFPDKNYKNCEIFEIVLKFMTTGIVFHIWFYDTDRLNTPFYIPLFLTNA